MSNWDEEAVNTPEEPKVGPGIVPKEAPKVEFRNLADAKKDRGLKILSYGNFSTGKTHFALSSTDPVFIIDTENGASPLAAKFPNAKVLNICNTDNDEAEEKDEVKNFEGFINAVNHLIALPEEQVGTIVIDSISDIWVWCQGYCKIKIFKLNIEDRLKQRFDWGIINNMFKKVIMKLINANCNVIFTAREGEIYDNASGPSGRVKPETQKKVPFFVDIVLRHRAKFIQNKINFYVEVEKCRINGKMIGTILNDVTLEKLKEKIEEK